MKERNSLVYEGVGYPFPLFATPSLLCLKPHCDCIDPLPPCAPEAALIVALWGFSASSSLFVLQEFGETGELEQAVETALPWECRSRRPPRWPFSYMWDPLPKPTAKQEVACALYLHKDSERNWSYNTTVWTEGQLCIFSSDSSKCRRMWWCEWIHQSPLTRQTFCFVRAAQCVCCLLYVQHIWVHASALDAGEENKSIGIQRFESQNDS